MYVIFHFISFCWKFLQVFCFLKGLIFFPLFSRYLIIMTLKLSSSVDGQSFCLEKHSALRFPLRLSLRQFAFSLSCRVGVEAVWVWSHQDKPGGEPQEACGRRAAVRSAALCPHQEGQRFRGWLRPWPWHPAELSRWNTASELFLKKEKVGTYTVVFLVFYIMFWIS